MSHFASRTGAVALTSAALIGLSGLAIPAAASAAEGACAPEDVTYSVTGGTIEWGFNQAFRTYFFGNFAHGVLTPSEGVSFQGEETGTDGRIVWPVTSGTVASATAATATGTGDANFKAHGGALDTTLSNPTVEISGTTGVLKLDYTGKTETGTPVTEPQADAANFTLPSALNLEQDGTVTTTATATLDEEFVPVFGRYEAGSVADPVTVHLTITETCADNGDGGDGGDNGDGGDDTGTGTVPGDDNDNDNNGGGGIFGSLGNLFSFLPF
ncbi:hypothetical protein G6016_09715 [Dietzia aerolata]|uniref:HtaA domain-containing protein n=1 Tax=Dietzia aerolata TaxID=595984 RepID=A0ABV5JKE1_9ACTN|nr:HtaA domain-containing protein [Dietzia aerolata]MBB0969233.1 hypothetical protein [Dietzia aerolata]